MSCVTWLPKSTIRMRSDICANRPGWKVADRYRDSSGRTRRRQPVPAIGRLVHHDAPQRLVPLRDGPTAHRLVKIARGVRIQYPDDGRIIPLLAERLKQAVEQTAADTLPLVIGLDVEGVDLARKGKLRPAGDAAASEGDDAVRRIRGDQHRFAGGDGP